MIERVIQENIFSNRCLKQCKIYHMPQTHFCRSLGVLQALAHSPRKIGKRPLGQLISLALFRSTPHLLPKAVPARLLTPRNLKGQGLLTPLRMTWVLFRNRKASELVQEIRERVIGIPLVQVVEEWEQI